jgi:hypothetical protein
MREDFIEHAHRLTGTTGNERLQEMMGVMASERGGSVFATDERYLISHNAEICPPDVTESKVLH